MSARAEFSFDRPFVVTTGELVFAGKRYKQGSSFPWRDLKISRERLWELWLTFVIDCSTPRAGAIVTSPPPSRQHHQQQQRR